ncbi:MAG: endonuclease III domain-containing protein [Deltaproteobacteria bacterium]|nr:MAG: endonuclease III domain-containing protein [Deltaproteobacteria bacterium]
MEIGNDCRRPAVLAVLYVPKAFESRDGKILDRTVPALATRLNQIYDRLWQAYGPQHWWPADGPLEVMVGAVLTQNTSWLRVERALANLKQQGLLSVGKLYHTPTEDLAQIIRPVGYFNLKARRLKNLIKLVAETYAENLQAMSWTETNRLREELLAVRGVGAETADSILLYAFQRPVFVVDTYTRRVISRHGLCEETLGYNELQTLFMQHLEHDQSMFNEYHALLVRVGKPHCRREPRCQGCPLEPILPHSFPER